MLDVFHPFAPLVHSGTAAQKSAVITRAFLQRTLLRRNGIQNPHSHFCTSHSQTLTPPVAPLAAKLSRRRTHIILNAFRRRRIIECPAALPGNRRCGVFRFLGHRFRWDEKPQTTRFSLRLQSFNAPRAPLRRERRIATSARSARNNTASSSKEIRTDTSGARLRQGVV